MCVSGPFDSSGPCCLGTGIPHHPIETHPSPILVVVGQTAWAYLGVPKCWGRWGPNPYDGGRGGAADP